MFRSIKFFRGKALRYAILAIIFITLSAVANVVQPLFLMVITKCVEVINTKQAIEYITPENVWLVYWLAIGLMAITAVIGLGLGFISYFWASKSSLYFVQNVRIACYDKILTYSFKEFDKVSTGSIITRIVTDTGKMQQAWQLVISAFLQCVVMMIGGSIISFVIQPIMGTVVLGMFAIMVMVSGTIVLKVMPMFSLFEKAIDKSNETLRENTLGTRVIKSFNLENTKIEEYATVNKNYRRISYRSQRWVLPLLSIIQFGLNAGIVGIMTIGGIMIKNMVDIDPEKAIDFSTNIYGLVQTLVMVLSSAVGAVGVIVNSVRALPSFQRCNELVDINSSIKEVKKPKNINEKYDIEFNNVSFKYADEAKAYVLKNINFSLKEGETLGIIGPTGSGKSTLINLIPRLYDVNEGTVKIGGVDVKELKIDDIRDKIRVALQELILFSGDIQYNLRYGKRDASIEEMKQACEQSCAWDFISLLPKRLEAPVEQRGRNFSGGQKQRICLARAIIAKPKILILDDVTCALDMITEKRVQNNLKQSMPHTTKIIVSQRVSSIVNADKIIVLDKGMINGIGTHDELIKSNMIYREIVESQMNRAGLDDYE